MAGFIRKAKKAYGKGKKAYKFAKKHEGTARKALAIAQSLQRMINVEYKYYFHSGALTPTSTGQVVNLFVPAQGSEYNMRDGDSVKNIRMDGSFWLLKNSSSAASLLRMIIFRGKQENATTFVTSDWLQGDILSRKNITEKYRTKTLYDKTFSLNSTRNDTVNQTFDIKLFGHTKFTSGTTYVEDGGIYMLLISNEATNTPYFNYNFRMSYTDN